MSQEIGSLLKKLLTSKETEAIISGLNIIGSLCGYGQDYHPELVQDCIITANLLEETPLDTNNTNTKNHQ